MAEGSVQNWYVRRDGRVQGPYPERLVRRYILLGRINVSDELSRDTQQWQPLSELPDLFPELLRADPSDPLVRQRLMAARRWEDERSGYDRRQPGQRPVPANRRSGERRKSESPREVDYRLNRTDRLGRTERPAAPVAPKRGGSRAWQSVLMILLVVGIGAAIYKYAPRSTPQRATECSAAPSPGVNWSNCRMEGAQLQGAVLSGANLQNANLTATNLQQAKLEGADLAYATGSLLDLAGADLRRARLFGTGLRNADLRGADLRGADLSYADLQGAQLAGARLEGAVLDKTIWVDGTVCAPVSEGTCR